MRTSLLALAVAALTATTTAEWDGNLVCKKLGGAKCTKMCGKKPNAKGERSVACGGACQNKSRNCKKRIDYYTDGACDSCPDNGDQPCMICRTGKACGDACIPKSSKCASQTGCAANYWEVDDDSFWKTNIQDFYKIRERVYEGL